MRNLSYPHDIIEIYQLSPARIYEIIAPFYAKNLSMAEIALETGFKKTTIWDVIKLNKKPSDNPKKVPYERWRKGHKRTGARPPYGFCFLLGDVVPEPREYPTLLVIYKLWKNGSSIMSIISKLEERGSKSRTGKKWSYGVIRVIVERFESGSIVQLDGTLFLSDKFLKGMAVSKKLKKPKR